MAGSSNSLPVSRGQAKKRARGDHTDRGRGSRGKQGRGDANTHNQTERQPLSIDDQEFLTWRKGIPFRQSGQTSHSKPLSRDKLSRFMHQAFRLIELHNDSIRHQVIMEMASEGGLLRVAELFDTDITSVQDQEKKAIFETLMLPFLQLITHPGVLCSLLLEKPRGDLYVFMYGTGGRRAIALFESYANVLQHMLHHNHTEILRTSAFTVLAALLQILKNNQTASIAAEFLPVVDVLQACLDYEPESFEGTLLQQAATRNMTLVRRILKYGESIEPLKPPKPGEKESSFVFELSQDGPGLLSSTGPRHDNDHDDITAIQILPTAKEIRSQRSEYLPLKDPRGWHIPGIGGILDQQFRLLREDTVGQLRDCVRVIMEDITQPQPSSSSNNPRGAPVKIFQYPHVSLADVSFDKQKKQLVVVASFDQPVHLRKSVESVRAVWWENSRQMQVDSLVCLLDSDGNALFFSVYNRGAFRNPKIEEEEVGKKLPTLHSNSDKAFVTLRLIDMDNPALVDVLGKDWESTQVQYVLVEFPGVLLPAFEPTLKALQRMSQDPDVPFSERLLGDSSAKSEKTSWPLYATQPGFYFDLATIAARGDPLRLSRSAEFDTSVLRARTSLDDAQCSALIGALSRDLALMQGPPGTGKSFVAIQIVKILLECRIRAQLNPIICVCYTNHALDQFLEQMLEGGVTQIIRIGGRSKSSKLEAVNLRAITEQKEATKIEKQEAWRLRTELDREGREIENMYQQLKRASQPENVIQYLQNEYTHHYNQLTTRTDEEGFETVKKKGTDPVSDWLKARPRLDAKSQNDARDRSLFLLVNADLFKMSKIERRRLHDHWISELRDAISDQLKDAIARFRHIEATSFKNRQEIKLRCLEEAHIIGITTSGLAKNVDLLQRLQPKVLICEEAGEILEAHTLTAFLPSIEHAILIGDHEQLRPQVQNYALSLENSHGKKYSLDMSTFERLISTMEIPHDVLQTQRRMDPSISDLIRQTIYPNLKDHDSVMHYHRVIGIRKRLFWLDHRNSEIGSDDSKILDNSHSNDWEVELVEALVMHLVRQGTYSADNIVVLTPYVRQLQKIRQRLATSFEIVIGDKDQDELAKENTEDTRPLYGGTHRAMLTQRLRISTVDNFQGEEAQVVVVSLVRSNPERKCGFLRTTNRINVLLSRAKHGLYILGDSQTYKHVPMWGKVINLLEADENIGFALPLCCPQHPDTPIEVTKPEDFLLRAPEGGCDLPCKLRLDCGHACSFKCHSNARHEAVICQEPCPRIQPKCGHLCPENCGIACGPCKLPVENIKLPCDHVQSQLECYRTHDLESVRCMQVVTREVPDCGHLVEVQCHVDVYDSEFKCKERCGTVLKCGHKCQKKYHSCRKDDDQGAVDHGKCTKICERDYTTCNHSCQAKCHQDDRCPLCSQQCPIQCAHSRCSKECHEPCAPCAEPCRAGCPHQGTCRMPCAVPCDIIPCSRRCEKALACSHQCPSVCGENCPGVQYCQICASEDIKTTTVDYIMGETYAEWDLNLDPILVPPCGHLIARSSMDGIMEMDKHYDMSPEGYPLSIKTGSGPLSEQKIKGCPQCRGSLSQIDRYARVVKRAMLDESTKRFISWSNAQFVPLTLKLQHEELRLMNTDVALDPSPPDGAPRFLPNTLLIEGPRNVQIEAINQLPGLKDRLRTLLELRGDINSFLLKVRIDEQPFAKVHRMYQATQRSTQQSKDDSFELDSQVLQTRQGLLTQSLLLRCDYAILSEFLAIRQQFSHRKISFPWLGRPCLMNLALNCKDCLKLAHDCLKDRTDQPMIEVEARVQFAKFVALERTVPSTSDFDSSKAVKRLADGKEQLELARAIVATKPSTAIMIDEIEAAEKMLRESTFYTSVTSAEKQAIYDAMAQDFSGTGHWYHCVNGHLFTVGECGMPMQTSRCPQCGAPVGGQSHEAVEGVARATDFEDEFGRRAG